METGTSVALPNAARGQIGSVASGPIATEEQYVTFTVGSEEYGVNILSVREIRGWTPETKLPNMPDFVRGVVNLRGIIIPIFDLRARFGGGSTEVTRRHVVVVLQVGERTRGILVDAISDILTVSRDDVKLPPDVDSGLIDQQYLSGLVTAENRMVTLLDVTRLFAGEAVEEIASSSIQIPHQAQA